MRLAAAFGKIKEGYMYMTNIAILGFGVVGSGIAAVIEKNALPIQRMLPDGINVKYILDKRDFPGSPLADRVVRDISVITGDPDVSVICEAMGGVHPAFEFTMAALNAGKSVVTSNKELVASFGDELMSAADKNGVKYLFEASVGGGIPEIRSMRTSLASDSILKIDGIMNGTTNYILTRMKNDGVSFDAALAEAQSLGYAESNPTADVDGIDAQRKIIILAAVATDRLAADSSVYTETMTKISALDADAASRCGMAVKLIASYAALDGKMSLFVCPRFVKGSNMLSHIDDVFNGIMLSTEMTGDVMFYGRGAGSYPTAAAMVSDVVAAAKNSAELPMKWKKAEDSPAVTGESVRLVVGDAETLASSPVGYAEFITPKIKEKDMRAAVSGGSLGEVESLIRVLD